jgi:hypothetical protein
LLSRAYYTDQIADFIERSPDEVVGRLTRSSTFAVEPAQRDAWLEQIRILRAALEQFRDRGKVYFEYAVPRMGKRIDVVLVIDHVVFVLEFKVGEKDFTASATDQVCDYALDLKNFHETSHNQTIAPVLIATRAASRPVNVGATAQADGVLLPIHCAPEDLRQLIAAVLEFCEGPSIDAEHWESGRYSPTPTIIEAAIALYGRHSVLDISRSDAGAINLKQSSEAISEIIRESRAGPHKSICFLTGVPGAGKTLVGLNIATQHMDRASELHSVFLSGNGPLVAILREALARDKVRRERESRGKKGATKLGAARSEVQAFIQNVHHFRDDCLGDPTRPPIEHVALFDEAQRAWNLDRTASFMLRKKRRPNFGQSEPEFLISCMDRHPDWAVVVCLVGGGQEINTGEAGIGAWIEAIVSSFPSWRIHVSPQLSDSEYGAGAVLEAIKDRPHVHLNPDLHLSVSMRSFRAENVSAFVKAVLDTEEAQARRLLDTIREKYPIVLTRDLSKAKDWVKSRARGTERYGMVVSSQAQRLKPHAIDVRPKINPIHWFLHGKSDVRSSYYMEDVATEFHVQGLELDWACVVWDGDFRASDKGWEHFAFKGKRWQNVNKPERQSYLKNAYRVLLTRARQGMVVVVPEGDAHDHTRKAAYYDHTYDYLRRIGIATI